jgi:hypothetical protein
MEEYTEGTATKKTDTGYEYDDKASDLYIAGIEDDDAEDEDEARPIMMPCKTLVVFLYLGCTVGSKEYKVYYWGGDDTDDDGTKYVLLNTEEYFFKDMAIADNAPATQWQKVAKAVVDAVAKAAAQPSGSLVCVEYPWVPIPDGVSFTGVEDGVEVDVGGLVGGLVGFQPEPGSVTHGSSLGRTFTVRGTLYYYGRSATKIHRRLATHMHWSEAATVTLQSFMTYSATRRMMEKLVVG